jgi:hypothetical protein
MISLAIGDTQGCRPRTRAGPNYMTDHETDATETDATDEEEVWPQRPVGEQT